MGSMGRGALGPWGWCWASVDLPFVKVWRAWDSDCSGYLFLRRFHPEAHEVPRVTGTGGESPVEPCRTWLGSSMSHAISWWFHQYPIHTLDLWMVQWCQIPSARLLGLSGMGASSIRGWVGQRSIQRCGHFQAAARLKRWAAKSGGGATWLQRGGLGGTCRYPKSRKLGFQ